MDRIDVMKARLETASIREKAYEEKYKEMLRISKMPFVKRIQQKGFEDMLEKTEETQRGTFERICKKDKIHKEDWKDEFALFWMGYLKGEYKSINQYLKRRASP